jgi:hypothetical protein
VELHHRREKLFVPEPEPVIRFLASGVGAAGSLPQGVEFARVMEMAERMVRQKIAEEGQVQVTTHAGAFVCR